MLYILCGSAARGDAPVADVYKIRRVVADERLRADNWSPHMSDTPYMSESAAVLEAQALNDARTSVHDDIYVVFKNDRPWWSPEHGDLAPKT